ncbi:MAG: hypothetical protein AB7S26_14530 [Sandaracinaceae bacterium]
MSEPSMVVLCRDDSDRADAADALRRAIAAQVEDEPEEAGPIALPVADDEARPVVGRLDRADIALALDGDSLERAREASVPHRVAVWAGLGAEWDGELDADLVLLPHDALRAEAQRLGVPARRCAVVGPIAPYGFAVPTEAERAALREERGLAADRSVVVVRAAALAEIDLSPALVQLSLVDRKVSWLFDVGSDVELARALRRHVHGYDLDAFMFADGDEAPPAYRCADAVLARLDGPEARRALGVGASLVCVPPRSVDLRVAHLLESDGVAAFADAPATLAVTLESALGEAALARGKERSRAWDAGAGASRVIAEARRFAVEGAKGSALAVGLPRGLERLADADPARERPAGRPDRGGEPGLEEKVDRELAELREKLGL